MAQRCALLVICGTLLLVGCGDYDVVDKSKYQVSDKSKDVVISKAEYEQLKADASLTKQVGRYQLDREGYRTWRLDTATGRSCLLLTTQADWNDPKTQGQTSCGTEDALATYQTSRK